MAGFLLNAFPFIQQDWDWASLRIMGVLQRIALAYGFSALLIIRFDFKKLFQILIFLSSFLLVLNFQTICRQMLLF